MPPKDKFEDMKITFEGGTFQMGNDSWVPSDGVQYTGNDVKTATVDGVDPGMDMTYSFGDIDLQQGDLFENQLRDKYPALKQAYEHYQNVLDMCKTREKEEDAN